MKQLEGHFATNQVNRQQVRNITEYKKSILARRGFSEVKMGTGSAKRGSRSAKDDNVY